MHETMLTNISFPFFFFGVDGAWNYNINVLSDVH